MKTQLTFITPMMAKQMLDRAKILAPKGDRKENRNLSLQAVKAYARDMINGKWVTTHQGIFIGKNGILIDGYHRLSAIVMSGVSLTMLVTYDDRIESPKCLPLDVGVKRSSAYILGRPSGLISVATLAGDFVLHTGSLTTDEINLFADFFSAPYETIHCGKFTTSKGITTAPIQLGACVQLLLGGNAEYISKTFKAMVNAVFDDFSPYAASFYRQVKIDKTLFTKKQSFTRSIRVFDESSKTKTRLQVKDEDVAWQQSFGLLIQCCSPILNIGGKS